MMALSYVFCMFVCHRYIVVYVKCSQSHFEKVGVSRGRVRFGRILAQFFSGMFTVFIALRLVILSSSLLSLGILRVLTGFILFFKFSYDCRALFQGQVAYGSTRIARLDIKFCLFSATFLDSLYVMKF